jgi:hypothetical protein
MAAAATNSSTFPLFSSLPSELRNQIWRDALPDKDGPALYLYKKGCWCPRPLSRPDELGDPANSENDLIFEFRHDLLDDVQVEVPLVSVSREARGIALAWVRGQGIKRRPREDRQYPVFVRSFDPTHDALYIALDKWDDFSGEPLVQPFELNLYEQFISHLTYLTRIAVPEALLSSEVVLLPEMFYYSCNLKVLFIIVDAPPDLQFAENDMTVQRRWEFESTQGGSFFWNSKRGRFDLGVSENIGDEALYRLLEVNEGLCKGLVREHIGSFEIRPVFAVRR